VRGYVEIMFGGGKGMAGGYNGGEGSPISSLSMQRLPRG